MRRPRAEHALLAIALTAAGVIAVFGALAGMLPAYYAAKIQPVEALLPFRSSLTDPLLRSGERRGIDFAGPHAAAFSRAHKSRFLQQREMLHHRRKRHGERACEVAHRSRTARQPFDHRPPRGIGESLESQIER